MEEEGETIRHKQNNRFTAGNGAGLEMHTAQADTWKRGTGGMCMVWPWRACLGLGEHDLTLIEQLLFRFLEGSFAIIIERHVLNDRVFAVFASDREREN